jgi:hypothetical protein
MKLKRASRAGPSRLWAFAFRTHLARMHMPFWRVVCECRPLRMQRSWPSYAEAAVTGVFVWARSSEEAEGLAALALEAEGFVTVTADAKKADPGAHPRKQPAAMARTSFVYLPRLAGEEGAAPPPRRGARA